MKFPGTIGGSLRTEVTEEDVRQWRIDFARNNAAWEEITPAERLVPRLRDWLVDAETDLIWRVKGGEVFARGSAQSLTPALHLTFYVDRSAGVVFIERVGNQTWSEFYERRERSRYQ